MLDVLTSLHHHSQKRPDDLAFCEGERALSYSALALHVGGLSENLRTLNTDTVAIFAPNGLEWVVADLALAHAGLTMVPLPTFFSEQQLTHIINDAGVRHVLVTAATREQAETFGPGVIEIKLDELNAALLQKNDQSDTAQRIIYTSGTTGAPKGVRIGTRQINASTHGLMQASQASREDRYLSILPFSLLLEQIAGICVPLMAGATVVLAPDVAGAAMRGDTMPLMKAFFTSQATSSVLVPGLLEALVKTLAATANAAPGSLHFVAVGGAPVNPDLADQAWALGVPVHEGYGLSECCSVVSVNRPGERTKGTTGQPIPGVSVTLDDGEIVVQSDTVMNGYLHRENDAPNGIWRTGDLGEFDERGSLRILGRKDNLIVTSNGRNISPEWVEGQCESDPDVYGVILSHVDDKGLVLIVAQEPASPTPPETVVERLHRKLSTLPEYARAEHIAFITAADIAQHRLISPMGDIRRTACRDFAANWIREQAAA